jgi:hypothetical protein
MLPAGVPPTPSARNSSSAPKWPLLVVKPDSVLAAGSLEQPRLSRRVVVCLGAPFINFSLGARAHDARLKGHWCKPHVAVLTFARTPAFADLHSVCDGQDYQESSRVSDDDGWPFTLPRLVD